MKKNLNNLLTELYATDNLNSTYEQNLLELSILEAAIEEKHPVELHYHADTVGLQWSVQIENTNFWIHSFKFKEEAIEYCKKEELPIMNN